MAGVTALAPASIALLAFVFFGVAQAAEPMFPPGSRVGLVPPQGFDMGKAFAGFEDRQRNSLIVISEYPPAAYPDLESHAAAEQMQKQGLVVEGREPMTLNPGPGFLVVGSQVAGGVEFRRWVLVASTPAFTAIVSVQVPNEEKEAYPDASVRAALATFAVRAKAPAEEQLGILPFTLRELAGFRVARVMAGSAALLTDGAEDNLDVAAQPLVLIAAAPGAPPSQPGDRDRFARNLLAETPGIKEVRLMRAEPLRIGGMPGHEILAQAKDVRTGTDVMIAQWVRFGASGHLRVLGIGRTDGWSDVFMRLRSVRDGVDLK
jgi:hypothetical protein